VTVFELLGPNLEDLLRQVHVPLDKPRKASTSIDGQDEAGSPRT
jgi:hypothetical protein